MKVAELLTEMEGGPNRFFEVLQNFEVYTGGGFTRQYSKVYAHAGDQIHWLHGGLFLVKDGEGNFIQLDNPDDYPEAQYHGARNNPVGLRIRQLKELVAQGVLEEIGPESRVKANYNT